MQRLIIMNGQCILQTRQPDKKWLDTKVTKAAGRRPGLYNLHAASPADAHTATQGFIVHVDSQTIYQHSKAGLVKHDGVTFSPAPAIGLDCLIAYVEGRAVVSFPQRGSRSASA